MEGSSAYAERLSIWISVRLSSSVRLTAPNLQTRKRMPSRNRIRHHPNASVTAAFAYPRSVSVSPHRQRIPAALSSRSVIFPQRHFPAAPSSRNMDEFRRDITQEGFKIFSNLDASQFFYRFRLDLDSARKNFGVLALESVYMFL